MPCLTKYLSAKKGPLSGAPKERGFIAPSSLGPQGRAPQPLEHHPTGNNSHCPPQRCHPDSSAESSHPAGPVLCQGSSALPAAFRGSSHDGGGTLGEPGRVPWLLPSLLCSRQGLAPGQLRRRAGVTQGSALSRVSQPQPSPGGGDTHPPAHTGAGGAFWGCCTPAAAGKGSAGCQRGLQAPGAAGCGPAGQGQ